MSPNPPEGTTAEYLIRIAGIIEDESRYSDAGDNARLPLELEDVTLSPEGVVSVTITLAPGRSGDEPELRVVRRLLEDSMKRTYPGIEFVFRLIESDIGAPEDGVLD